MNILEEIRRSAVVASEDESLALAIEHLKRAYPYGDKYSVLQYMVQEISEGRYPGLEKTWIKSHIVRAQLEGKPIAKESTRKDHTMAKKKAKKKSKK